MDEFRRVIDDPNAPERLKGLPMYAFLSEKRLEFKIDMPDDPTPNEIGYVKLMAGEMVDKLKQVVPPEMFGEPQYMEQK